MQKYLPITNNTRMRSYTYDAYLDAIISNKYRTGSTVASIKIDGYEKEIWEFKSRKLIVEKKDSRIFFKTNNKYSIDMNGILFRPLQEYDELALSILYQQYSQPWGNIGIFIANGKCIFENANFLFQFGVFNKTGCYLKDSFGNQYNRNTFLKNKEKIVLRRQGNKLYFEFAGEEQMTWKEYTIGENEKNEELKIGIYISLYNNVYYDWLYSNHIQWKYNKNEREVMFEYETSCRRDWNYYTINYFLVYKVEKMRNIRQMGVSLLDYVKANIDNNSYIELWMQCYDLIDTVRFRKEKFMHQCLIYGYNDRIEKLSVLCVNRGKPFLSKITYKDFFMQSQEYDDGALVVSQDYNPETVPYNMTIQKCMESIECYLEGKRLMDWELMLPSEEYYYGIDVYGVMKDKEGIMKFLNDKRMCRMICEHKLFMVERLEYLVERGMVEEGDVSECLRKAKMIYDDSLTLQHYVVKYMLSKRASLIPKAINYIEKIENAEKELYPQIIQILRLRSKG